MKARDGIAYFPVGGEVEESRGASFQIVVQDTYDRTDRQFDFPHRTVVPASPTWRSAERERRSCSCQNNSRKQEAGQIPSHTRL